MPLLDGVRLALQTIRAQKLKSGFTLLGVCIGVMFLIAVVSIIEGMGRYMKDELVGKLIGVNSFEVRHRPNINIGDVDAATWEEYRRRPRLWYSDVPTIVGALPEGTRWAVTSEATVRASSPYGSGPRSMMAYGVEGDFFGIRRLDIAHGRLFSPQEYALGTPVAVIGPDVATRLFPGLDPLGRELRVAGVPYQVVGVLAAQGKSFGVSFDNVLYTPWQAPLHRILNTQPKIIDAVVVQTPTEPMMVEAQERVREALRARRGLRPGQQDDFALQTSESALAFWNRIQRYLVLAGIAFPAIGLVVGAIVIMNIMLVAVAERTREIGIRKALGARRRDILLQFLIESSTLATVGAAIGIGLGIALSQAIAAATPLPATVAPWSIVVGVLLGAGVGVVSGVYPASRAARLDPIAALRQE
jgi:putative ABC transport system permease protein